MASVERVGSQHTSLDEQLLAHTRPGTAIIVSANLPEQMNATVIDIRCNQLTCPSGEKTVRARSYERDMLVD